MFWELIFELSSLSVRNTIMTGKKSKGIYQDFKIKYNKSV